MTNEEPTITTNEPKAPFFTLYAEEVHPLALMCMAMADSIMKDRKKFAHLAVLEGEFLQAFNRLKERIFTLTMGKEEYVPADVPLDAIEGFALMYGVSTTYYGLKGHMILPKEQRNPISADDEAEIETLYYELKDGAANLIERLTIACGYIDYGLQTLEEVFERHIAARPLQVDDKRRTATLPLNEPNINLLGFIFHFFTLLEFDQEKYDFAYRFFHSQFIHINDYNALKAKLLPALKRKRIDLTLKDNISLYYTLNLFGRVFVSDAAQCFEEVGVNVDAEAANDPNRNVKALTPQGVKNLQAIGVQADEGTIFNATSKDSRSLLLTWNDNFIASMHKHIQKRDEDNKIFEEYIKRVDTWDTINTKATDAPSMGIL